MRLRSNGLRVLLIANPVAPVATFAIVYHVGSRNEAVGHTGATHLLEHLMFKGTAEYSREKGTAIAAVLEALGARFNATTWFDRTNYYETIPSDQLEVAVHIEASRMRGSLLRDEDRAPEMTVVRNEFERGENSPVPGPLQGHVRDRVPRASVPPPDDRLAKRHRGRATTARLKEFYDVFYHPNNATAVLIGDFEEPEALATARAALRRRSPSSGRSPRSTRSSRRRRGSAASSSGGPARSPGSRSPGAPSRRLTPTRTALAVLGNVLGVGLTARLYLALVEESLALSVTVVPWQLRDPALFSVFAPVRPGRRGRGRRVPDPRRDRAASRRKG